jgi:glycosyltransferase
MKVSLITPSYNSEDCIEDCMQSIDTQTYSNIEHIMIDGGSSDDTLFKIKGNKTLNRSYVTETDNGIYDALNKGLKLASGEIIGILNSDDIYASKYVLEKVMKIFEDYPETSGVYGDLSYINDNGQVIRYWRSSKFKKKSLKYGWMPPHPTLFVRREWYDITGTFDSSLKISADYKKILQIFDNKDFKSFYLHETLVYMRIGGASNANLRAVLLKVYEDWKVLREYGFNCIVTFITIFFKNFSKFNQLIMLLRK